MRKKKNSLWLWPGLTLLSGSLLFSLSLSLSVSLSLSLSLSDAYQWICPSFKANTVNSARWYPAT